jgi:hypothetical protein
MSEKKNLLPTSDNCAAAANGAAIAPSANKAPAETKEQPKSETWTKYKMVQVLPKIFSWRDKRYETEALTEIELEILANDKDFKAIVQQVS